MTQQTPLETLTHQLWECLDNHPWSQPEDLAEALIWLSYARFLDQDGQAFLGHECDKRWRFWLDFSPRLRYRHLKEQVYPVLQTHAPMTGHLLGLILPTVPFAIPEATALSRLLELLEQADEASLLEALLPLLGIHEPSLALLEQAVACLQLSADDVIWEPCCRSARFLAICAQRLAHQHWRQIWSLPQTLANFRERQFFGRVQSRPEALLSAWNLLKANQPNPGLDGYSLPAPRPSLIWVAQPEVLEYQAWLSLLAPGGRLAIWHRSPRRGRPLASGSLEIIYSQPESQVRERPGIYQPAGS